MAIFSLMVVLASMALNQGLSQYQGLMERGLNFWDYAKNIWLDRSFNSAVDYYVYKRGDNWFPYFTGNQEVISYVSLSPVAGELPVVVWIRNERDERGMRSLVYYELPVYTKTYQEIERDYAFGSYRKGNSVKLLDGAEGVEFRFYGYDILQNRYLWTDSYDGRKKKVLPGVIKITFSQDGNKRALIFGMKTDSRIKTIYNEVYQKD